MTVERPSSAKPEDINSKSGDVPIDATTLLTPEEIQSLLNSQKSMREDVSGLLRSQKKMIVALSVGAVMMAGAIATGIAVYAKVAAFNHSHVVAPPGGCTGDLMCEGVPMFASHNCEWAWCESSRRCHLEECSH